MLSGNIRVTSFTFFVADADFCASVHFFLHFRFGFGFMRMSQPRSQS